MNSRIKLSKLNVIIPLSLNFTQQNILLYIKPKQKLRILFKYHYFPWLYSKKLKEIYKKYLKIITCVGDRPNETKSYSVLFVLPINQTKYNLLSGQSNSTKPN